MSGELASLLVVIALLSLKTEAQEGSEMPGGLTAVDKSSNEARTVAYKGAKKITEQFGEDKGNKHFLPVGIGEVTVQVVNGINRKMDLIVASSNCGLEQDFGEDFNGLYQCGVALDGNFLRCQVTMFSQVSQNVEEVTVEDCKDSSAQEALSL